MTGKNRRIPIRRLISVIIGWVHCALIFSPLYALILNFTNQELSRETVIENHLRGLLIIVPVMLSWFAARYLRNILLYLLSSAVIVIATMFLFDTPFMAAPAVLLCFLRLYNRLLGEKHSLLDNPAYPGLAAFLVPAVAVFFQERLNGVYQYLALLYMAVYFLLCFIHHGISRIDSYIGVNKDMRNMPARRIVRISTAILGAAFVIFAVILLPALIGNDIEFRYTPPPVSESQTQTVLPSASPEPVEEEKDGELQMLPDVKPNPVMTVIMHIVEYAILIAVAVGAVFGVIYGALRLSRSFSKSFHDREDFVENLQDDRLETIREAKRTRDRPRFLDRSPNASVRRKYRKTILRAAKEPPQAWMSPAEAEAHARLTGGAAERLHTLYEKARYSPDGCTKQDAAKL
ncbi:MAG: hypothetical protein ACI4GO_09695 [Hominenteromicrobium sp.]